MSYQQKKIKEILDSIYNDKILLPAIQRDYVWDEDQVVNLFDSIMRKFPIGSFLFWKKTPTIAYAFRRDFDPNVVENTSPSPYKIKNAEALVLDGQQRLTSLYIGFHGSYISKGKSNYVYFNFSTKEFALMTDTDDRLSDNKWLKVSKIAAYEKEKEFVRAIEKKELIEDYDFTRMEENNLKQLFDAYQKSYGLQIFEIPKKESLSNVLDIFVRINSGGENLSKTDLLFSSIITDWEDGRKSVKNTIDYIWKKLGKSSKADTDFVIKNVLYMSSNVDVKLKIENIQDNLDEIKFDWDDKIEAIKKMVDFVQGMGFHDEVLVSYNAMLPLTYWIYKKKKFANQAGLLRMFFIISQLKQLFSGSSDTTLNKIRGILDKALGAKEPFPLKKLKKEFDLNCTSKDVSAWLKFSYKNKKAYAQLVLSLLQPKLNYADNKFHLDHLHPQAYFKAGRKCKIKDDEKRKKWEILSNRVPNLQLLLGAKNESKNDTPLLKWVEEGNKIEYVKKVAKKDRAKYYSINNFANFFKERESEMRSALNQILKVKK